MHYLILVILIPLAACSLGNPTPSAGDVAETPISSPTQSSAGSSVFTDTIAGFTFNYPEGWHIIDGSNPNATSYAITLTSYDTANLPGSEGVLENETKIDFFVMPNVSDLNTWLDEFRASNEVLEESSVTLDNGASAMRMRVRGSLGDEAEILMTVINGYGITASGFDGLGRFDEIAGTLRPA
jgi:hypothetical protein